jgi:hypothetical protein
MRTLLACVCLVIVVALATPVAFATTPPTEYVLQTPSAVVSYRSAGYVVSCIGVEFNNSDTVHGSCHATKTLNCGRGCTPPQEGNIWLATWDDFGNPTLGVQCASRAFYNPWIYAAGFNASNCGNPPVSNGVVQVIYGPGGYITYAYYVSTSADGAYELVETGVAQF